MAANTTTDKVMSESRASLSNEATQFQSVNSSQPKDRKKRSKVWDHFRKYTDGEGSVKAICQHCKAVLVGDSKRGTSGMLGHIKTCKKMPRPKVNTGQTKIGFEPAPGGKDSDVSVVTWTFLQEECRKALCRMVIIDELPFSFVEKEGFRKFMKVSCPHFRIPSRSTVTRDCFALFNEEKHKLKKFFRETNQRICLTTDTWTSIQRINYMCLTAHWIDPDWKLHKRILNFCPIASHKGEDMAKSISKCLLEWGLDKIFTVTVDNASSNDTTVKELSKQLSKWGTNLMDGKNLHVRCMAHIINLVVQDGIKESNISVERVRHAVRYIRQSPARWKKFQECCEDEMINFKKCLCLDVPTRWNSTYLMLNRALEYENAFSSYGYSDPGLSTYLENALGEDKEPIGRLLITDWEQVKRTMKFLEIFYELTVKISGSLYITSNFHFLEICEVACYLNQLLSSEDPSLGRMAKNMKEKFDKYWGDPKKMNKMIFISCVLDPRHKLEDVGFALAQMFGEEKGKSIEEAVKTYMTSLFNEYVKPSSRCVQLSPVSSSSTNNTCSVPSGSQENLRKKICLGSFREELKQRKSVSGVVDNRTELEIYLGEKQEDDKDGFSILLWWKLNSVRFPVLAEMARDVLAIPVSSVASECAFSTGGRILDSFRSSLTPKLVQALVCLQDWMRSESLPISVEEDLDFLEQLEQDMANIGIDPCIVDV